MTSDGRSSAGAGGREAGGHGPGVRRRAVDLEHGLHHPGADGRGARGGSAEVGQRRRGDRGGLAAGRGDGSRRNDAAGTGPRDGLRADRRRRARHRPRGRPRRDRNGHGNERVDSLLGELLVPLLGRRRRSRVPGGAEGRGQSRGDTGASRRRLALAAARGGGRALAPCRPAAGHGARPLRDGVLRHTRTSTRRTNRTGSRPPAPTASSPTSPSSRSTGRRARYACSTT